MRRSKERIPRAIHYSLTRLFISSVILLVLVFTLPLSSYALIGLKAGDPPPEIVLEDLNRSTVDLSEYYGRKPVIIVFWELTMSKAFLDYSLDVMRYLNNYYVEHHEKTGLEIFGVYTPEEEKNIPESELERVRNLVKVNRIKFPVIIDRGFTKFREFGVIALPSTIMIDKSGRIKFIYPSFPMAARKQFARQIEEMIGLAAADAGEKDTTLEEHGSHSLRLYNYALQIYKKGLLEQALSPLEKSLHLEPGYASAHNLKGIVLWKRGSFEGAAEQFELAINLDNGNDRVHFNYGLLLFLSEKYDRAQEHIKISISLNEKLAEAHYVLGMLYKKTKNADGAIKELGKALELFEDRAGASAAEEKSAYCRISTLYELSLLYGERGNQKKAMDLLIRAARIPLGLEGPVEKDHLHKTRDMMMYE